jgi:hypothetical protein
MNKNDSDALKVRWLEDFRRHVKDSDRVEEATRKQYYLGYLNAMVCDALRNDIIEMKEISDVTFSEILKLLENKLGFHWTKNGYDEEYYVKSEENK